MQQFQDDIMRAKQLALEIEERLMEKIESLERRVSTLEDQLTKTDQSKKD
ncbi:MAG: hypothetical protein ACOCXS_02515 [Bacteroidota bacterium]